MNMKKKMLGSLLVTLLLSMTLQATLPPLPRPQVPDSEALLDRKHTQNDHIQPIERTEYTLSIIKPDGVSAHHIGDIISRFEKVGLRIAAMKMMQLSLDQARKFYYVHRDRPFYSELVEFMSSGPVVIMVLEGPNAVAANRKLMGATNPQKAEKGTIRADYAESVTHNTVHGSDSSETAREEIAFFFQPNEIFQRY